MYRTVNTLRFIYKNNWCVLGIITVYSEIHTKLINRLCGKMLHLLMWVYVVHIATTGLLSINVLPLASEFMLSLLSSVVENLKEFERNLDVLHLNTSYSYDLPMHILTSFSMYQVIQQCSSHNWKFKLLQKSIISKSNDYRFSHCYFVDKFTSTEK